MDVNINREYKLDKTEITELLGSSSKGDENGMPEPSMSVAESAICLSACPYTEAGYRDKIIFCRRCLYPLVQSHGMDNVYFCRQGY